MLDFILQWAGNILIIASVWFIGEKKRWAFLMSMAGNSLWLIYAAKTPHQSALGILAGIFVWLQYRNWVMWKEKP